VDFGCGFRGCGVNRSVGSIGIERAFPLLSDFQPIASLLSLHEPGSFRRAGSSKNRHQMWLNKDSGAGRSFKDIIIKAVDSIALEPT
jgi:hypothetical protein